MKRTLMIGAATAALLLAGAGVALAQDDTGPKNCGDAVVALTNAQNAHTAAVRDDEAAADAQKLYDNLAAARAEEAAAIKADNETVPPLATDSQRTTDAKAAVGAAQKAVDDFEAKGVTIEHLREVAGESDVKVTGKAVDQARADFDRLCQPGDPAIPPSTSPAPADESPAPVKPGAPGYSQVQAVPVGGVATGA